MRTVELDARVRGRPRSLSFDNKFTIRRRRRLSYTATFLSEFLCTDETTPNFSPAPFCKQIRERKRRRYRGERFCCWFVTKIKWPGLFRAPGASAKLDHTARWRLIAVSSSMQRGARHLYLADGVSFWLRPQNVGQQGKLVRRMCGRSNWLVGVRV